MESLKECGLLKFRPDTLHSVRAVYNLDQPGRMEEAIDILQEWARKQNHFVIKDFDRDYLERTIIFNKGSIERAKLKLDRMCTMRTLLPDFFERCMMTTESSVSEYSVLPELTPEGRRVFLLRSKEGAVLTRKNIIESTLNILVAIEYIRNRDYNTGFIEVLDLRRVNMIDVISNFDVAMHMKFHAIIREGYGIRLSGIHVISHSKLIDEAVRLVKPCFPEKIGKRIQVHSSIETLYNYVPKELFCKDYGGNAPTLAELLEARDTVINSESNKQYMKRMHKYRTDESKRIEGKSDVEYLSGTFRRLDID